MTQGKWRERCKSATFCGEARCGECDTALDNDVFVPNKVDEVDESCWDSCDTGMGNDVFERHKIVDKVGVNFSECVGEGTSAPYCNDLAQSDGERDGEDYRISEF